MWSRSDEGGWPTGVDIGIGEEEQVGEEQVQAHGGGSGRSLPRGTR